MKRISTIERDSVKVIEINSEEDCNYIRNCILVKDDSRKYIILLSNENMSIIRNGLSYFMFSAGFIARDMLGEKDKLILEFDENKIKKYLRIGYMRVIAIIGKVE